MELLPEPFRSFVDVGAKAIGCDPGYIALPALATAAAAIGTTRCIRLKRSWEEPVMVWALTVGRSGTMRSPAFDLAVKPLRDRQTVAVQEYHDAMKQYEREEIKYEEDLKKWKAKKAKGAKGNPPSKPKRPVLHRYICSDTTIEAIADVLQYAPRGLLLARDELSGLIRSFNAYRQGRGGDEAHWLEMFRAGELLVDRKTATTIYVRRAGVSICGTIQRGTLTRAFGREHFENGMMARFLLCDPPSPKKKWTESDVPRRVEANYAKVIKKLLTLGHSAIDGEPLPVPVRLTDKAKAEWVAFFDEHAAVQADLTDDDIAAAFSKLEGYAARFALIVHLIRRAAGDQTLADAKAVDEQSIRVGVALARWFCHETKRIYQSLGENEQQTEQRRLVDWIQQRGGSVTVREVQQNHRRYATAQEARAALELLVEAEIGKWVPAPPGAKGGRPSEKFELVYSANVYETSTPDSANGGFVGVALARWFCHETKRIYQSLGENEQQTEQRRLVDWIQQRGGSVTVREVQQNHRRYATAQEARAALELLVEAEIGKWVPAPPGAKGGRPSEKFELVYSANVYETSTPDSANGGFVDVDGVASPGECADE